MKTTEKQRASSREYYRKNKDKRKEWYKGYYAENKEEIKRKARERYRKKVEARLVKDGFKEKPAEPEKVENPKTGTRGKGHPKEFILINPETLETVRTITFPEVMAEQGVSHAVAVRMMERETTYEGLMIAEE